MSQLVVLHGLPACGKLTIGKKLFERLQNQPRIEGNDSKGEWSFFHNHLIVDAVLALFPFGSPKFREYREKIWLSMIPDAIRDGRNIIFTFSPDRTVSEDFPEKLEAAVVAAGGKLIGIKILCPNQTEIDHRLSTRIDYQKLKSVELYHELLQQGAFDSPHFPGHFEVDSSLNNADQSAALIESFLKNL